MKRLQHRTKGRVISKSPLPARKYSLLADGLNSLRSGSRFYVRCSLLLSIPRLIEAYVLKYMRQHLELERSRPFGMIVQEITLTCSVRNVRPLLILCILDRIFKATELKFFRPKQDQTLNKSATINMCDLICWQCK